MKKIKKGTVEKIEKIAQDTYALEISSDIKEAHAGQFISILCPPKTLRRPFSIKGFKDGKIQVFFKVKGEGTNYIKSLKVGDSVDFMGALGTGFNIENKKSLLVGAGIGIAPMLFLKDELNSKGIENFLITGFKAQNEVIEGSDKTVIGGSVIDYLDEIIKEFKPQVIYSCGPEIVLKLVNQKALEHNIDAFVAMEKVFACQVGVCRGCVIKVKKDGKVQNATICHDGPVFKSSEVVWE